MRSFQDIFDLAVYVGHEVYGALECDTFNVFAVLFKVFAGLKDYLRGFIPEAISHGMRLRRRFQ